MKNPTNQSVLLSLSSALLALSLISCGGGGGGSSSPIQPSPSGPEQFDPSEPGLLTIGPVGLALQVGDIKSLEARLYDALGFDDMPPKVTWSTETPETIALQADGSFEALAVGTALVTATDAGRRVASLIIEVFDDDTNLEGPTAVRFASPILNLVVGEQQAPMYELTDKDGEVLLQAQLELRLFADGDRIEVDAATGLITGIAEGLAVVTAAYLDTMGEEIPLQGQLIVLVLDPAAPTKDPEECEWSLVQGAFYRPPVFYARPDLAAQLRTLVYERLYCDTGISGLEMRVRQLAPISANIADTSVVAFNRDGLLESRAAGQTMVAGIVQGDDGSVVTIPGFMVTVLPDLGGKWHLTAANGDTGEISLPAAPGLIEKRDPLRDPDTGALLPRAGSFGIMTPRVGLIGDSTLTTSDIISSCEGQARFNVSFLQLEGGGSGACSETNRGRLSVFSTKLISYCGEARHPAPFGATVVDWFCTGPETLRGSNGVELTRMTPSPVSDREFSSVEVNGVLLQDSNPLASLSSEGELLITFFENGDDEGFGVGILLSGINQPGKYLLSNVGGLNSDDTNFVVYGRFEPPVAFTTGPNHVVLIDVQQIDDEVIQATFSGILMDLNLAGTGAQADVILENGQFRAEIEAAESGTGSFLLDGMPIQDPEAYAERDGNSLYIDIEEDAGASDDSWSLTIELENVTVAGTYLATNFSGPNSVNLGRPDPVAFFSTGFGREVVVMILEIDASHIRGTFRGTVGAGNSTRQITNGQFDIAF